MRKHGLPGEAGDSTWFERLNEFERQETKRQVEFKRRHWPELPDGVWSKQPTYSYPHILPDGHLDKVFYPPIADSVISYCCDHDIAIHSEALNLRSSQVACFNVMFPLRLNLDLAQKALKPLLPGVKSVNHIEFEYTGDEKATAWLGEPAGGKRGQHRTSIDVAVWWEDSEKSTLTLVEWKYTERGYGTCGGFESTGNKNRQRCLELDIMSPWVAEECYLTQGKNTRLYWRRMQEAGIDLASLTGVDGCSFRGPFYQLLRQYLLAAFLRQAEMVDEVNVALVAFRGNHSLHQVPPYLKRFGDTVISAWNSRLIGVPALRHTEVEDIADAMKTDGSDAVHLLVDYLNDRYGL